MADSLEWTILDALVETLAGITGLHPTFGPDAKMVLPAAIPLIGWDHNSAWGDLTGPMTGSIYVLFRYGAVGRDGYRLMYDYTSPVGDKSITAKLAASHVKSAGEVVGALATTAHPNGVVAGVRVGGALKPQVYTFGDGILLWGRELPIRLWIKEL